MRLSRGARTLTILMTLAALSAVGYALHNIQPIHDYRFPVLLILTMTTARLKVKLPGLTGNMSVNLPFVLIAAFQLSMLEALAVALPSCVLQTFPKGGGKPKAVQMIFNVSATAVAIALASALGPRSALLGAAAFFLAQTVPVASIIRLTEGGSIHRIWGSIANYSFPFYVLSAGITSIATSSTSHFALQVPLLGLPVLYAIYKSYETYFNVVYKETINA